MRIKKIHILTSLCLLHSSFSFAAIDTIIVSNESDSSTNTQLSPSYQQEQKKLKETAGGTNLIAPEQEGRLATLQDALDYQPGIIVQNFFGGTDQPRINIRGSGVQSAPVSRGVMLLQDGLPITDADGNFHISTLDMRDARLISVYRGANSIHPQINSLGGELDFISYTGRDETLRARYEYGSFGRTGSQIALGGTNQQYNLDGRISVSYDHFDGYRDHSSSQRKTARANFGYVTDNFENRTWLSWTDLRFDVAGSLSQDQLKADPSSVYKAVWLRDPHRTVQQGRIANRSNWQFDNQSLELGLWYQQTHDNFITPTTYILSDSRTKGAQFMYQLDYDAISYRSALAWDHTSLDRDLLLNRLGTANNKKPIGYYDATAENIYASVGSSLKFAQDWQANLDIKVTHAKRDVFDRTNRQQLDQSWTFWTPKLGVIWTPNDTQRFYANVSTSHEPASFREIITNDGKNNKLNPQKGITFEIGGDGEIVKGLNWDLALYRSMIKDEYITTYDSTGTAVGVFNYANKTRHQGIEAGIKGLVPVGVGDVVYRLSWTYSDFRFMGGEYNGKYIAGIPRNVISGELLYKIDDWSFGPNIHWLPTNTPVDHANSMDVQYRDKYAIWGFKINYQNSHGWSAYLIADNLTNKRYATASVANRVVSSKSDNTLFPGMKFNLNGGIMYQF